MFQLIRKPLPASSNDSRKLHKRDTRDGEIWQSLLRPLLVCADK